MKSPKFPPEIFVTREALDDDSFLNAAESHEAFDDGQVVAVYRLVDLKVKAVQHSLKEKR